jgi:hypothetical protein
MPKFKTKEEIKLGIEKLVMTMINVDITDDSQLKPTYGIDTEYISPIYETLKLIYIKCGDLESTIDWLRYYFPIVNDININSGKRSPQEFLTYFIKGRDSLSNSEQQEDFADMLSTEFSHNQNELSRFKLGLPLLPLNYVDILMYSYRLSENPIFVVLLFHHAILLRQDVYFGGSEYEFDIYIAFLMLCMHELRVFNPSLLKRNLS